MNPLAQQLTWALAPSVLPTSMVLIGILVNNSRLGDVMKRLDRIDDRLTKIEERVTSIEIRVTRLEERTSLVR